MNMTPAPPEEKAFCAAILPHLPALRWLARHLNYESEDMVQDVLLKAWRSWPPPHDENIKAWILTICRNFSINAMRKRGRRVPYYVEYVSQHQSDVAQLHSSIDEAEVEWLIAHPEEWMGDDLLIAWRKLTPGQQQTITHLYVVDDTLKETVEEMGCPLGTVMSRSFRGLNALRKHLGERRGKNDEHPGTARAV